MGAFVGAGYYQKIMATLHNTSHYRNDDDDDGDDDDDDYERI